MVMIVYKATNKNGKCYIGQTINSLKWRKSKHINEANRQCDSLYFHNALRKYDFTWDILCKCKSQKELNDKERYYIKEFDSIKNGYNILPGGEGNSGCFVGVNNGMYGRKHSSETIDKMRRNRKGKNVGKDNPIFGRKRSEKVREAVSKANKNRQAWNKGLTKETDDRVKKNSDNRYNTMLKKGFFKKDRRNEI